MEVWRVRDEPLQPGKRVKLEFELPGRHRLISVDGVVVFDRDATRIGVAGVRFDTLDAEDARSIDEFVRELMAA